MTWFKVDDGNGAWPEPLAAREYEHMGVMPFQELDGNLQDRIEQEIRRETPPDRWRYYERCLMPNRAWYEWHARRGRDPHRLRRTLSAATRTLVVARDKWTCQLCGGPIARGELHIDHVVPVCRGGRDNIENLQATHGICNLRKGARTGGA